LTSTSEKKFFNKKTVKIVFKEQIVKKTFVFELSVLNKLIISIKNIIRNNIKIISDLKKFFLVLKSIRVETSKIIKYNI
tara:strand:- start:154 stop:390 length:237 start_codon:yes stop_codon:yes gene_type:complete